MDHTTGATVGNRTLPRSTSLCLTSCRTNYSCTQDAQKDRSARPQASDTKWSSKFGRVRFPMMARMSSPLRATISPSHPLARRDAPCARARVFQFAKPQFKGVAKAALYCAHRTPLILLNDPSKLARITPLEWHPCWSHCGRRARLQMLPLSSLVLSQGWELIDLPLRASNEGLLRPRVARAQKIIRLHPLLCSGSKGPARVSFHPFSSCAFCEQGGHLAAPSFSC